MTNRRAVSLAITAVTLVAVLAGCTSNRRDDTADEEKKATTTTVLPEACEEAAKQAQEPPSVDESTGEVTATTLPPACADALFGIAVGESASDALKELPEAELLGYAHGACAFAAALTVEGTEAPTYQEFVETTSESWGQSPEVVEEIVTLAATLCPGQLAPLTDLATGASKVTLRLQVIGKGIAQVTYQGPGGDTLNDEVTTPWDHEVTLDAPAEFRLSARIPDGAASCSIMVGATLVVEQETTPGEEVVCAATASELRDAAR